MWVWRDRRMGGGGGQLTSACRRAKVVQRRDEWELLAGGCGGPVPQTLFLMLSVTCRAPRRPPCCRLHAVLTQKVWSTPLPAPEAHRPPSVLLPALPGPQRVAVEQLRLQAASWRDRGGPLHGACVVLLPSLPAEVRGAGTGQPRLRPYPSPGTSSSAALRPDGQTFFEFH